MNIKQSLRAETDGVSLAGIVARESGSERFSGGGPVAGVGFGGGDLGLGVGGASISGTRSHKTARANMFRAPEPTADNGYFGLLAFGAALILLAVPFVFFAEPLFSAALVAPFGGETEFPPPLVRAILFFILLCALFIVLVRGSADTKQAQQRDEKAYQIWLRMRYVERDHVVFDPVAKLECMASRGNMLELIDAVMKRDLPLATQHAEDLEPVRGR